MTTPPTPEELLRLARKAFPVRPEFGEDERDAPDSLEMNAHGLELSSNYGSAIMELHYDHPQAREGLHAFLSVLSGELDVAELLAERDRLRDGIKLLIAGAEEERYGGGHVVGVGQLEQLLEDP